MTHATRAPAPAPAPPARTSTAATAPAPPAPRGWPAPGSPVRQGPPGAVRRLAVPAGVLAAVAGGFAYVAAVNPNEAGHYPLCPLRYFTGVYCPGCGGLRGAYALAHGHLRTALECNAPAVAGYAVLAVVWAVWVTRAVRGRPFEPVLRPGLRWAVGVLMIVFTVVRNLPFGAALAP